MNENQAVAIYQQWKANEANHGGNINLLVKRLHELFESHDGVDITRQQAGELQDVLRTIAPSGVALLTSARELVKAWELAKSERDEWKRQWLDDRGSFLRTIAGLNEEISALRTKLLTAAGDDLCRLSQDEIKAYTSGEVQIPPEAEFLASCKQFHSQVAGTAGVLPNCLTMAQLVAENERLNQRIRELTGVDDGLIDQP